jgi:hypothetical protein
MSKERMMTTAAEKSIRGYATIGKKQLGCLKEVGAAPSLLTLSGEDESDE